MAKIKSDKKTTTVKFTRQDGGFVYNRGVGIHVLLPEHIGKILEKMSKCTTEEEHNEVMKQVDVEDVVFISMYMVYLEAARDLGMKQELVEDPNKYNQ